MRNRSGFTILEVLLALAVVALVMAVIAPAMVGAFRAQRQARRILEPLAQEQAAWDRFRTDLAAATPASGLTDPAFTLALGEAAGHPSSTLTVLVHLPPPMHPNLVVSAPDLGRTAVTWTLQAAEDGRGLAWTRSSQANLLATGTAPAPVPEIVLDHLESLTIEVMTDGAYADTYDSDSRGSVMPPGIRVRYRLLNDDDTPGPLRVQVLDMASVILGSV